MTLAAATAKTDEIRANAKAIAARLTTQELQAQITKRAQATGSDSQGIDAILLDWMLDVLATRMPESEFVVFCDAL